MLPREFAVNPFFFIQNTIFYFFYLGFQTKKELQCNCFQNSRIKNNLDKKNLKANAISNGNKGNKKYTVSIALIVRHM